MRTAGGSPSSGDEKAADLPPYPIWRDNLAERESGNGNRSHIRHIRDTYASRVLRPGSKMGLNKRSHINKDHTKRLANIRL
jgi:hypothetical protein